MGWRRLHLSKCKRGCLLICFSSGLDRTNTIEIGLWFVGFSLSLDLYRGITVAILQGFVKVLFIIQRLKTYVGVLVISGTASSNILVS